LQECSTTQKAWALALNNCCPLRGGEKAFVFEGLKDLISQSMMLDSLRPSATIQA
jgi:hypothetical protein